MFEEDSCFICGKPTAIGSLYCSDECKGQDSAPLSGASRSSNSGSVHSIHPIADVPALSPYANPHDPDSDVPEHDLGESALHTTPSTSPTSSLFTDEDEEDNAARQRETRLLAKSLPPDMQTFDRHAPGVGFNSYQTILSNYQRPAPRPKHPNLAVPVASRAATSLHFRRVPARLSGYQSPPFQPSVREKDRSASDRLVRSSQSSPSRRHSFPTLAHLGLNLPSPQPSPHLWPTKPSRPKHSLVARHSTSSYQQRPKLDVSAKRPATFPHSQSPETPKVAQPARQTEAQAIAAMTRARDASRGRTPAPRLDEDDVTTPTQTRESERGRSRTRQAPTSRSRSRSKSRSKSHLGRLTSVYPDDTASEERENRRPSRGLLPSFGIGALTRGKAVSEEREEFRGRRGRAS